jgi:hypothetical protein
MAASCEDLEVLELPEIPFTECIDQAVADYVRKNAYLKKLTVSCPTRLGNADAVLALALKAAMKSNYRLREVCLRDPFAHMKLRTDPWDADTRLYIDMITRLNRAGRGYLATEPMNRHLGVHVLGQVKDDLGCLFFHLQENPLLVKGTSMAAARSAAIAFEAPSRKRSASSL